MSEYCRCGSRGPDNPCNRPMTQEDGLCDGCRANYCIPGPPMLAVHPDTGGTYAFYINGRWELQSE